jgi:GGDEF domain-containing protein
MANKFAGAFDDLIGAPVIAKGAFDDLIPPPAEPLPDDDALMMRARSGIGQMVGGAQQMVGEQFSRFVGPGVDLVEDVVNLTQGVDPTIQDNAIPEFQQGRGAVADFAQQGADVAEQARLESQEAQQGITRPESFADAAGNPLNAARYYGGMVAESLPAMAGAMATRRPELATGLMGAATAGQTYGQERAEGATPEAAANSAVMSGVMEGALGQAPFATAMGAGKLPIRAAKTAAQEAGTESLTGMGQLVATDAAKGIDTAPSDIGKAGLDSAIVGAALGPTEAVLGSGRPQTPVETGAQAAKAAIEAARARQAERDVAREAATPANPAQDALQAARARTPGEVPAPAAPVVAAPAVDPDADLDARLVPALAKKVTTYDRLAAEAEAAGDAALAAQHRHSATVLRGRMGVPNGRAEPVAASVPQPVVEGRGDVRGEPTVPDPVPGADGNAAPTPAPRIADPEAFALAEHRTRIEAIAQRRGLDPEATAELVSARQPLARDPVTDFYRPEERAPFVRRAIAHVAETGEPAFYVEADIRNLGGLNATLGVTQANAVYRSLANFVRTELEGTGAQVVPVRNGGDEVSYTVIGGDAQAVQSALVQADSRAQTYLAEQGLADISHPKGGAPGAGLIHAFAPVQPDDTLESLFSAVDQAVELRKKEHANGYRTRSTTGPGQDDPRAARSVAPRERGPLQGGNGAPVEGRGSAPAGQAEEGLSDAVRDRSSVGPGVSSATGGAQSGVSVGAGSDAGARDRSPVQAAPAVDRAGVGTDAAGSARVRLSSVERDVRQGVRGQPEPQRPRAEPLAPSEAPPSGGVSASGQTLEQFAEHAASRQRDYIARERGSMQALAEGNTSSQSHLPPSQRTTPDEARERLAQLDRMESEIPSKFSADALRDVYEARKTPRASTSPSLSLPTLRRAIVGLFSGWQNAPRIETVATLDDLPPLLREDAYESHGADVEGLFDPKTGTVYLIAENIASPVRARWVAFHEVTGHYGLRGALDAKGQGIGSFNRELERLRTLPTVDALAKAIAADRNLDLTLNPSLLNLATEEAVAELSAAERTGDWSHLTERYGVTVPERMKPGLKAALLRFIDAIKRFFAAPTTNFTDADWRRLVEGASRYVRVGTNVPVGTDEAPLASIPRRRPEAPPAGDGAGYSAPPPPPPDLRDFDFVPSGAPKGLVARASQDVRDQVAAFQKRLNGRPANPRSVAKRLNDLRATLFDSVMSRARALERRNKNSPNLRRLFNLAMAAPGDSRFVAETTNDAIAARFAIFTNRVRGVLAQYGLERMTEAQNDQLRAQMLSPGSQRTPAPIVSAATRLRRLMDIQREDLIATGVDLGEATDVGYLTRMYDEAKILDDEAGFLKAAQEQYAKHEFPAEVGTSGHNILYADRDHLARFLAAARRAGTTDARVKTVLDDIKAKIKHYRHTSDFGDVKAIEAAVDSIYDAVAQNYGEARASAWLFGIKTPDVAQYVNGIGPSGAPVTKSRVLSGSADKVMAAFLKTDMLDILDTYGRTVSKKIEFANRFGPKGEKLQALIDEASREGVPKADLEQAVELVNTALGLKPVKINPALRSTLDFVHAWTYLGLLPKAAFSSVMEAITFSIRTGQFTHTVAPLIQVARAVSRSQHGKDLQAMAQAIGINGHQAVEEVLMNRLGGDYAMTPQWSALLHRFFKATLLTPLTRAQRAYGVGAATGFLRDLAKRVQVGKSPEDTAAHLNELGIADHAAFAQWMLAQGTLPDPRGLFDKDGRATPRGQDYMVAVRRIVDQSIQNPNAAHRPAWTNNPAGRLVTGIMSFSYASYENVIKGTLKRASRGDGAASYAKRLSKPVVGALALIVGQTIMSTVREVLFNADRLEDKEPEEQAKEMLALGLSRTFGLGSGDPIIQYLTGLKYQRSLAEVALGAGPGMLAQGADTIANLFTERNSANTETAEFRAGQAFFRTIIAPAMNAALSRIPIVGGAAIIELSDKEYANSFGELFGDKPEPKSDLDRKYDAAMRGVDTVVSDVQDRIALLPQEQWAAELEALKAEYPAILADVELDTYKRATAAGKEPGDLKATRDGKPKLKLASGDIGTVLGELEGYPYWDVYTRREAMSEGVQDEISALNKAIKNLSRDNLTQAQVLSFTSPIDPDTDFGLADTDEPASDDQIDAAREHFRELRRTLKHEAIDLVERAERGEPIPRTR